MATLYWLIPLALLLPMLWVLKVVMVAKHLLGLRFAPDHFHPIEPPEVPFHHAEAMQAPLVECEALGFRRRQIWRCESGNGAAFNTVVHELVHESLPVRALLQPHPRADRSGNCWLILRTTLADGRELETSSYAPERILPPAPGLLRDALEIPADSLLRFHLGRLAKLEAAGASPIVLAAPEATLREEQLDASRIAGLKQSGGGKEEPDGRLAWRLGPALKTAARLVRDEAALLQARKKQAAVPPPAISAAAQVEFDWDHYSQGAALQRGRISWLPKTLLMVGSLALFSLALGWQMSLVSALVLIGVLVIHECGHLLGMWAFGFRDTQLLFLPFLGAAAAGTEERVIAPWKHLVILFLGPLPGLFAAVVLLGAGLAPSGWLREAALMAIGLNVFNLLPILPLDGGQIVAIAFADRFPRLRVIFLAASGIGLALIGLALPGAILLAALGGLLLFQVPVAWLSAGLVQSVRRELPAEADEARVVHRLLAGLRQKAWSRVPPARRLQLARTLQITLRRPRARWGTLALAAAGYLSPLWVAVPAALWAAQRHSGRRLVEAQARAEAAGLPQHWARPAFASVPEADNAAVPVSAVLTTLAARREAARIAIVSGTRPARRPDLRADSETLDLLRAAAARPRFVPKMEEVEAGQLEYMRAILPMFLAKEANARLAVRQRAEALGLARDGLRLARRLADDPEWWGLSAHLTTCESLWTVVEQCLSEGATVTPEDAAELAALADEAHLLVYARSAAPLERLAAVRAMQRNMADPGPVGGLGLLVRAIAWMGGTDTLRRWQTQALENAVKEHQLISDAANGGWDRLAAEWRRASDSAADVEASYEVFRVAALVARLRQARAALAISWQQARTGKLPARFDEITAPWWRAVPLHPLTGQPLQWRISGRAELLAFDDASAAGGTPPDGAALDARTLDEKMDASESFDEGLGSPTWRLPERL